MNLMKVRRDGSWKAQVVSSWPEALEVVNKEVRQLAAEHGYSVSGLLIQGDVVEVTDRKNHFYMHVFIVRGTEIPQ